MNQYGLTFHHFGLAVAEPVRAIRFLNGLGYAVGPTVFDPLQNVNLIACTGTDMPEVELVFPSAASTKGPLDRILAERQELIYHLCYSTSRVSLALETIKAAGNRVICVSPPKPALLFNGLQVSFYQVPGFGLIELLEIPTA
jgi:methylmalonyl-CoA/ethylmalonyl-CoA epimerase